MSQRSHHRRSRLPAYPLWIRWAATLCLALVAVASSAQAVHMHGSWLPDTHSRAHSPVDAAPVSTGDETCPLCMAMHSALPTAGRMAAPPPTRMLASYTERELSAQATHWPFAMFSRPPPQLA